VARSRLPSNNEDYALASKMQLLVLTAVPYYGFLQCTFTSGARMFNFSQVWVEKRAPCLFFFFFGYAGKRCSSICCFGATFPQTTSQRALNSLTLALGRSWQKSRFFHVRTRQGCFQEGEVEEEGGKKKTPKNPFCVPVIHLLPVPMVLLWRVAT